MATKAAKSITINATKYELANALGVANGKLQLKAKDVVLDEAEAKFGGSWIAATCEFDNGQFIIKSLDCSDDIDPTTYTAMDLYNAWTKGDLKITIDGLLGGPVALVNEVLDSVEWENGQYVHYIYVDASGVDLNKQTNDKAVYICSLQFLYGTDTIDKWTTTNNQATKWEKLCTWS